MTPAEKFNILVGAWPGVTAHPHRFEAREFRYGGVELGHLHPTGELDLPLSGEVRTYLLGAGFADPHRWVPDSGWVTFRIRGDADVKHAAWLLRLSYVRQALKRSADPATLFAAEAKRLALDARLQALLMPSRDLATAAR